MRYEIRYKGQRIGEVDATSSSSSSFVKLNELLDNNIDATEISNFSLHPIDSEDPEAK
jgi:hypothetical protein